MLSSQPMNIHHKIPAKRQGNGPFTSPFGAGADLSVTPQSMQNMIDMRSVHTSLPFRQASEPIVIKYSGYLLKRSNKPFQTPPFSHDNEFTSVTATQPAPSNHRTTTESSSEVENTSHLPQHQLIEHPVSKIHTPLIKSENTKDANDPVEVAISMASVFFGCHYNPNEEETVSKKQNVKSGFAGNNYNNPENFGISNNRQTPNNNMFQVNTIALSQYTSQRINIPNYSIPQKLPRSSSSSPTTNIGHHQSEYTQTNCNSPPQNIIDPNDGHIWRAKYCILENGILYFYRNEVDANTLKAKSERTEFSLFNHNWSHLTSSYHRTSSADSLSTSPIPRPTLLALNNGRQNNNSLFNSNDMAADVMWEKRVALDRVGAVRSAEDEHGKWSFVLLTSNECNSLEEQDCLVLRSRSTEEMQEWLFQLHRSLAFIVKEMVFHHPAGGTGTLLPPEVHYPLVGLPSSSNPRIPIDKRITYNNNATNHNQTSFSYSPRPLHGSMHILHSLSHGHGRNDMHRRRVREKAANTTTNSSTAEVIRSRASSIDSSHESNKLDQQNFSNNIINWDTESLSTEPSPFDLTDDPMLIAQDSPNPIFPCDTDIDESNNSNSKNSNDQQQAVIHPSKLSPQMNKNMEPINATPTVEPTTIMTTTASTTSTTKYIPPHLRNKKNGKYVPPHLRKKPLNIIPPLPLTTDEFNESIDEKKENIFDMPVSNRVDFNSPQNDETDGNRMNTNISSKPIGSECASPHFKLGGCADKDIGSGSIMDPIYKKRSVKLGKGRTDTYGFMHKKTNVTEKCVNGTNKIISGCNKFPNWEVGAVSACGVRSSNEDAYLIANDLMHVLENQKETGKDYSLQGNSCDSSRGLFAVFDGHCGFQTARYAAEKFTSFLLDSILEQNSSVDENELEGFFSDEKEVIDGLRSSIAALDKDFCVCSTTEGREWGDSGATALVTILSNETLYVANLGDCRGILCGSCVVDDYGHKKRNQPLNENDGWSMLEEDENMKNTKLQTWWKEVTDIHNPSRVDEKERIEGANGWITTEQEICFGQIQRMDLEDQDALDILKRWFSNRFTEFNDEHLDEGKSNVLSRNESKNKKFKAAPGRLLTISRICGELGVSRALGDRDFKSAFNSKPTHGVNHDSDDWWEGPNYLPYPKSHNCCFRGDLVSSTPEFQVLKIGNNDVLNQFLILACDGLWDVMDADDAARIARDLMFEKGWSAESSAARLAELAIHLGSSDNITVILIRFFHTDCSETSR